MPAAFASNPTFSKTSKNLYWGRSQVNSNFKKPKDYFDIAFTYFDDHNYGVSISPHELTVALNKLQEIATNRPSRKSRPQRFRLHSGPPVVNLTQRIRARAVCFKIFNRLAKCRTNHG